MKGKDELLIAPVNDKATTGHVDHAIICPKFEHAFTILGKRWNGLIIRTLVDGPMRFSAIEEAIPALSARMLSERCRELEDEGIIERHVFPEKPVRIEYELTPKGHDLEPALDLIQVWSDKWCSGSASADETPEALEA